MKFGVATHFNNYQPTSKRMDHRMNDRRGANQSSSARGGIPLAQLPPGVESFKVVKTGELFYVAERSTSIMQSLGHVYARRGGVGGLTAIPVSTPVVIWSMKASATLQSRAATAQADAPTARKDYQRVLQLLRNAAFAKGMNRDGEKLLHFTEAELLRCVNALVSAEPVAESSPAQRLH